MRTVISQISRKKTLKPDGFPKFSSALSFLHLNDAVVHGRVSLPGPGVEGGGVLHQEVHHVQRVARLVRDGVVETSLAEFLEFGEEGGKKPTVVFGKLDCICTGLATQIDTLSIF